MLRRLVAALALVVAGAATGLALHLATAQGDTMFAGKRPTYLGVKDGRLPRPRSTPNCVSSQADPADKVHYIEPIRFEGPAPEAVAMAQAGGTIPIRPGTYDEALVIDKDITIRGDGLRDEVVVQLSVEMPPLISDVQPDLTAAFLIDDADAILGVKRRGEEQGTHSTLNIIVRRLQQQRRLAGIHRRVAEIEIGHRSHLPQRRAAGEHRVSRCTTRR